MALTKQQWRDIAEAQAAAEYGRKYAKLFMFRRFLAAPIGIATAGLVVGVVLYLLWTHLHLPSAGGGHLSAAFWVFAAGLGLATAWNFRPGRFVPAAVMIARGVVFALLWLGVAVYAFVVLI